ncbi:Uncharacterised protein [uncultured archaeon]|nr:Uncharacterised protein [uncultured archaeon]
MSKINFTHNDVLEWIKIGVALIIGFIIIKALLKVA